MDNNKINYDIKKISRTKKRLKVLKNKKIKKLYCFFIISMFLISILLPTQINAFTGETKSQLLYINLIKFTFPNIKIVSKKHNESLMKNIINYKNNSTLLKNEIEHINEVKNNKRSSRGIKDIGTDELFTIENKSISKFKDNDEEITNSKINNKKKHNIPQVLIYHTHTHEGFIPEKERTDNEKYNVCGVGDILTRTLEKEFNINVIHDTTIHDNNYTYCYVKSGKTLDKYLKEYGDFDLIIDLHRDGLKGNNKNPVTCKINNRNAAKFEFVVTTENPYYKYQKSIIDNLLLISNKHYPELIRGNGIHAYKRGKNFYYSQNKSKHALLIEIGAQCNHIDEAKLTAKYLGRIMGEYLKTKK